MPYILSKVTPYIITRLLTRMFISILTYHFIFILLYNPTNNNSRLFKRPSHVFTLYKVLIWKYCSKSLKCYIYFEGAFIYTTLTYNISLKLGPFTSETLLPTLIFQSLCKRLNIFNTCPTLNLIEFILSTNIWPPDI